MAKTPRKKAKRAASKKPPAKKKRARYVPTDPNILNADDAAKALGITKLLLLRLARDGELPGRKVGKEWRFHRPTLQRWLAGESELGALAGAIKKTGTKVTTSKRGRK